MSKKNEIIDGKYQIQSCIGKGGMSTVYLVKDMDLNVCWAMKEIKKKNVQYQSALQEIQLMKECSHPFLCRIVNTVRDERSIYIIMDYIDGISLDKLIQKRIPSQQEVVKWARELCEVLIYLHSKNIIYRDMKPANVMLTRDGHITLIDFGIARVYKESKSNDTMVLGTKGYAAPEQYNHFSQSDQRSDIYSLGATLHHLLTGISPGQDHRFLPIRSINPNLSSGLESILIHCLEIDPQNRYASVEHVLYALNHYEQQDKSLQKEYKKTWLRFVISCSVCISCLISSVFCFNLYSHQTVSHYQKTVFQASQLKDPHLYCQAIQLLPDQSEAYYGLINAFKEDGEFSLEEDQIFKEDVLPYISELKEDKQDVYFNIGILYWYYYSYGSSLYTRMQMASDWFKEGDDISKLYYSIASVYKTIYENTNEGRSDAGLYKQLFEKLKQLNKLDLDIERLQLEKSQLIFSSLEVYAHKYKADGISKAECMELYNQTLASFQKIQVTTESSQNLKATIDALSKTCLKRINDTY